MLQERVLWIDKLKAFGILSVILGHIQSPFGAFIFSWHMPLFFFLSGFFIHSERPVSEFLNQDFRRIMIPFFIFALIAMMIEPIKRIMLNRESLDYFHEYAEIFIYMDYAHLNNTYAFVLWFLPALLFGRLIVYLIIRSFNNIWIQSIVIIFLFFCSFYIDIYFGIDNALNAILFIFIGFIFYGHFQDEKKLYILLFVLPLLFYFFGTPALDMASKEFENIVINILYALSIIFILVTLSKKISIESRHLSLWGSNTMLLFIIHPYTNNIGHLIVKNIQFGDWFLKFIISIILLHVILQIKKIFINRGIFKYV